MGQKPTEEELFQMISEVDDNMSGSIDFPEFLKVSYRLRDRLAVMVEVCEDSLNECSEVFQVVAGGLDLAAPLLSKQTDQMLNVPVGCSAVSIAISPCRRICKQFRRRFPKRLCS